MGRDYFAARHQQQERHGEWVEVETSSRWSQQRMIESKNNILAWQTNRLNIVSIKWITKIYSFRSQSLSQQPQKMDWQSVSYRQLSSSWKRRRWTNCPQSHDYASKMQLKWRNVGRESNLLLNWNSLPWRLSNFPFPPFRVRIQILVYQISPPNMTSLATESLSLSLPLDWLKKKKERLVFWARFGIGILWSSPGIIILDYRAAVA